MMLTQAYRKAHTKECPYGRHCCTTDDRPAKLIRRQARKIEKREWRAEL
jgi:hypothetical protein